MPQKVKVTAKKWMGDDSASWAVFRSDYSFTPIVSGLTAREVPYYKRSVIALLEKEGIVVTNKPKGA